MESSVAVTSAENKALRDQISQQVQLIQNLATAPKALLEELALQRTRRSPPSGLYRIVATGDPGGRA